MGHTGTQSATSRESDCGFVGDVYNPSTKLVVHAKGCAGNASVPPMSAFQSVQRVVVCAGHA